ncbi:Fic family protein [Telmatospirillum sp. J64-1]|uniref:Fic family protein n=1 Tax=Telmatospirillum sp. J64-1 TaxID=2502183 RepID=UPI00115F3512|nr:Fic family protein [Telmatospirillum sp. J64-1]
MALTITQFQKAAADGGMLKLENGAGNGQPTVGKMSIGGRIAQWFRGDSLKAENRQIMQSFVAALEKQFGSSYATTASQKLDIESGKPLSARTVNKIIQQGEAHMKQVKGLNFMVAYHFSENTAAHDPHSFGKVFSDLVHEKGMDLKHDDKDLNLSSLQQAIKRDIERAGFGNQVVSMAQAREVTEKRVERFLDNKLALLQTADRLSTNESDRAALRKMALSHDMANPQFLEALWNNRDAGQALLTVLGNPEASHADRTDALHTYFTRYDAALTPLLADMVASGAEVGADDLIDFNTNLVEMGLLTAGASAEQMQTLWTSLTSPEMSQMRDSLNFLFCNGADEDISARSLSTIRSLADTVTLAIRLVGPALGRPADEISAAMKVEFVIERVDDIPEAIIDSLRGRGMGDVNFTIDKQIERVGPPEVQQQLSNAWLNLNLSRDVLQSGNAEQLQAQAQVLTALGSSLAGIQGTNGASTTAASLRNMLEHEATRVIDAYCDAVRQAGPDQAAIIEGLSQARQMLADLKAASNWDRTAAYCDETRIDLQSEIFTRAEPLFQTLDSDALALSVKNRKEFGRIISQDLSAALARPIAEENRPALQQMSQRIRDTADQLDLENADPGKLARATERIDAIRMGSSDTIAGKSGGGEIAEGQRRATDNWKAASAFAREIASSNQPLTLDSIKQINRLLNTGMPANEGIAGEFRERPETAGGGAAYLTPERIPLFMDDFMTWLNDKMGQTDPIELAALAYQKLVSIHPFSDGNGRTCRLVADIILQRNNLPPAAFQGSNEVNVSVFAVPQKGQENISPEEAVRRMASAVERSLSILSEELA